MEQIKKAIENAKHVVFFTGAGISTESGIPDFRSNKGLAGDGIPFEKILDIDFFHKDKELFWRNIYDVLQWDKLASKEPNTGHKWIQSLETENRKVTVLTQNIDGLHKKAGSSNIIELHGTIQEASCPKCGTIYNVDFSTGETPRCKVDEEILKPCVVLYGEEPTAFYKAMDVVITADVYIAMGSTLKVAPVNSLIEHAKYIANAQTFIINNEATPYTAMVDRHYYHDIAKFVTAYNGEE